MINIIRFLNIAEIRQSEPMLADMQTRTLQELYCECVNMKKLYPLAYTRLLNEMDKRKDQQIAKADAEHCAALDKNVAAKEDKASL